MNNQERRPKATWIEDKVFEDKESELCVVVQKLPLFHPRFSLYTGRMTDKGFVNRFISMRGEGRGKITMTRVNEKLGKLLREAEDYIWSELQYHEDQIIESKLDREHRDLNRNKHKPRVGLSGGQNSGKTARKRENKLGRSAGQK